MQTIPLVAQSTPLVGGRRGIHRPLNGRTPHRMCHSKNCQKHDSDPETQRVFEALQVVGEGGGGRIERRGRLLPNPPGAVLGLLGALE